MQPVNYHLSAVARAEAHTGMSMIRPVVIPRGQYIYRFCDRSKAATSTRACEGAWWLEFDYFQSVKHFALRHGYSLSYAVRLFAAILYEFSEVNALVICRTLAPLSAWKGRGKQMVLENPKDPRDFPTMTPMQGMLEIYQLYIPGLVGVNSLAHRVLQVDSFNPI